MDLFHGDNTPPFDGDEPRPGREDDDSVLVRTASKVNVRLKPIRHHLTPDGSSCLGSFVNGNLIARCVLPEQTAAQFLRLGILEEPVHLALLVREADPGLQGKLLALTPLPDDVSPEGGGGDEPDWKESVPSSNYEQEVAEGGAGAGPAGPPEGGGDDERLAAVFLGKIIRFEEDRKHPDNLAMEAADVLRSAVKGGAGDVVDRLLQDVSEDVEVEGEGLDAGEPGDGQEELDPEAGSDESDGDPFPDDEELFPDDLEMPEEPDADDSDGPEASDEAEDADDAGEDGEPDPS